MKQAINNCFEKLLSEYDKLEAKYNKEIEALKATITEKDEVYKAVLAEKEDLYDSLQSEAEKILNEFTKHEDFFRFVASMSPETVRLAKKKGLALPSFFEDSE